MRGRTEETSRKEKKTSSGLSRLCLFSLALFPCGGSRDFEKGRRGEFASIKYLKGCRCAQIYGLDVVERVNLPVCSGIADGEGIR